MTQSFPKPKLTEITQEIILKFIVHPNDLDEYSFDPPVYAIGDLVAIKEQYDFITNEKVEALNKDEEYCEEPENYEIIGLKLNKYTLNNRLREQHFWSYLIKSKTGTKEEIWFDENELVYPIKVQDDSWFGI
jgi:hypothetical protein